MRFVFSTLEPNEGACPNAGEQGCSTAISTHTSEMESSFYYTYIMIGFK